jgi:hypothetical protein
VLLLLTYCSSNEQVFHYNFIKPESQVVNNTGYLKIYTQSFEEKGSYSDDPVYYAYKSYSIYTTKGEHVLDVEKSIEKPAIVKLPAGEYVIVSETKKNSIDSFSVMIESGKILEISNDDIDTFTSHFPYGE